MTPMQRFIPGLGQPLDFAAMAAGQGGMNPLAEALGGYRQQNTLAAAPTIGNAQAQQAQAQQQAQSLAAMMEAYKSAQGDQQLAQELMRPEYASDSGALGALAMIAQTYAGRKMSKKADESASQYADRIFAEEQRMAQEQAAAQAKAEEARLNRTWAREDQRDAGRREHETALAQLRIDEANRRAALQAQSRIDAARIGASGQRQGGGASVLTADEVKAMGLTPGTVAQRDRNGKISIVQAPKDAAPNPKEAAVAMVSDAINNLEAGYRSGQYNTGPLEGRFRQATGDSNLQVLQADVASAVSGLRALQRVPGSGAESDRELDILLRQMPTELTDEEAALKILERARAKVNQYAGSMGIAAPAAPAPSGGIDALLDKYK